MLDPVTPYSTAKGYVQSAFALMANELRFQALDDTTFFLSFHMLAGFASELYLKSFLLFKGHSEVSLRAPGLGHNLGKLYEMSIAEGLNDKRAAILVELLGEQHKNFEFRYMHPASQYTAMDLRLIFIAFSSLDTSVDTAIGASVSRGLRPGQSNWAMPERYASWRFIGVTAT